MIDAYNRATRSRQRWFGLITSGFLIAGTLVAVPAGISGQPAQAAEAPACSATAAEQSAAARLAKACGTRVEVLSARTETTQVFANPDGSGVIEEYAYPQRVRRPDNSWSALDADLARNPDGSWSPRAAVIDVSFSDGGTGPLATARRAGGEVAISWPGTLPPPTVSGATATYPGVLPGVDLLVTAQPTGFSEVLVVKDRAAAGNPALRRLAFGASLRGLRWENDEGGLWVVDPDGRLVLGASAPLMWDSSAAGDAQRAGGRGRSDSSGPAIGARAAAMKLAVSDREIALTPDLALLTDPAASYPLYLDPTIGYSSWTMINSRYTTQSYWSYDRTDCPSGYSTDCGKVGYTDAGTTMTYRSMWQFPTSGFQGKQILNARFTIDLLHSWDCTNSTTELRTVNSTLSSGVTWSNTAAHWSASNAATVSNQSCTDARKLSEFGITSLISGIAGGAATSTTLGLKASTESSHSGWKKFDAKTARLVVTTNTVPAMPDQLTVDGKACVAGANRPVIATATPSLRVHVYDADGDTMNAWFSWAKWDGATWVDQPGGGMQGSVPNNTFALYTATGLVDTGIYTFRAQTNDSPSHSPYAVSPVTQGNCEWEVDLRNPDVPTVNADIYKEGSIGCPVAGCGSVGQTGRFTLSSSPDVVSYKWGWSSPPSTQVDAATPGASVSVDWTPAIGGPQTLYVQAIDRAGRNATKTYQFYVAPPSVATAQWKLNDNPGTTGLADSTGNGHTAWVVNGPTLGAPGRIAPGGDGSSRTAMALDGIDDRAETAGPAIADTSKSFSVSAWAKLADNTVNRSIASQGGSNNTAFWLEYKSGAWTATASAADQLSSPLSSATATSPPRLDTWTHLTATYDSAGKTLRIYVNGVLEGTATGVTTWDGNGQFRIGGYTAPWRGSIAEVQVWNRMISAAEVFALSDPVRVGLVGKWDLEDVGPGPSYDASGLYHDLSFHGGATIPPSGSGHTGTGLRLDGIDDYAETDGPVLYTDQSFTVSAWAYLPAGTVDNRTVLAQRGNVESGFYLKYEASDGYWRFTYGDVDGTTGTGVAAKSTSPATLGAWTHLVGVYDAQAKLLRFFVNGVAQTPVGVPNPWHATGPMALGRVLWRGGSLGYWSGSVDEFRVYQGAVTDVTRIS
jgi:hypothetical protein